MSWEEGSAWQAMTHGASIGVVGRPHSRAKRTWNCHLPVTVIVMNKRQRKKQTKQLLSFRDGLSSTRKNAESSAMALDILASATKEVVLTVLARVMRNANQRQNRRAQRPMFTLNDVSI